MFGTLGGPEVILILVVALIVFGPRRLPEIGKSMGKMLAEFRKASNDFKRTIEDEIEAEKTRETTPAPPPTIPEPPALTPAPEIPSAASEIPAAITPPVESPPADTPPVEAVPVTAVTAPAPAPRIEAPAEAVVSRGPSSEQK